MKRFVLYAVVLTLLFTVSTSSFAKIEIRPFLQVTGEYNDNLFLERNNREEDFITYVYPSLLINYFPRDDLNMSLQYGLNFRFYANNSQLNTSSLNETQNITFETTFRPTERIFLDVSDIFRRVPIDEQLNTSPDNLSENMTEANVFRISPYVVFPIAPALTARVGYGYENVWYNDDALNDSESHSAFAGLTKVFPFDLSLSVDYDYSPVRSDTTNYDIHGISFNATYQINERFTIWGGFSQTFMNSDNFTGNDKIIDPYTGLELSGISFNGIDEEDEHFWNAGASYNWDAFGGTELNIFYEETYSNSSVTEERQEELKNIPLGRDGDKLLVLTVPSGEFIFDTSSSTQGLTKLRRFDMHILLGKEVNILINPYYKKEETVEKTIFVENGTTDKDDLSRKEISKGITFRIAKPIHLYDRQIDIVFEGSYSKKKFYDYSFDEKVTRYTLGPHLNFNLSKSIYLVGGYSYHDNDSDIDIKDYYNNVVWLEARVHF